MTLSESLRILDLTAPITREELDLACQDMMAAAESNGAKNLTEKPQASKLKIKTAHTLLSMLSDAEFPFADPKATASGRSRAPGLQRLVPPAYLRAVAAWTAVFLAVPAVGWLVVAVAGRPAAPMISEHAAPETQQATPAHYSAAPHSAASAPSKTPREAEPGR